MSEMSYEMQSEARVWVSVPGMEYGPLKLTISEVSQLYEVLEQVLRDYSSQATEILSVLPTDE